MGKADSRDAVVGSDGGSMSGRVPFGLITRRSRVQITPPLPLSDNSNKSLTYTQDGPRKRRLSDAVEQLGQPERLKLSDEGVSGYSLAVAVACVIGMAAMYACAVLGIGQ
jgi:hypothetical protein